MPEGSQPDLFSGLPISEETQLRERLRPRRFAPGATILLQGQLSGELHIIRSGTVSVRASDTLGRSTELARLGPGEIVGEMSLLTAEPHSATVLAITPTATDVLGRDDFLALVASSARLAQNLSRILSERLLRTNRRQSETRRVTTVAVACPTLPAAAPALALNLAVSLARQSRSRVLLATDTATLGGPLAPLRHLALPALTAVARDPAAEAAHREAPPGHPALHGVQLCALDDAPPSPTPSASAATIATDLLGEDYGFVILATGNPDLAWARGAARLILATPLHALADGDTRAALAAARDLGSRTDLVITDLPRLPSVGEVANYRQIGTAPVLVGLPIPLATLTDDYLPPLVRRDRRALATLAIDRLARDVAGLRVGLALGAGSARGFAHIGVLRVLEREGVPVDALAGTSIGAVVGAMWASGMSAEQVADTLTSAGRGLLRFTLPYASLFSNRSLQQSLRGAVGDRLIEDLPVPFAAVAVDLATRLPVALHQGPLWRAVLASAAIPGIYPPVLFEGRTLIDGVVRDPLPTSVAADLGADVIIGVRLSPDARVGPEIDRAGTTAPHGPERATLLTVVFAMLDVMQEAIESHGTQRANLIIHPPVPKVSIRQFSEGQTLIRLGQQATEEALPTLRRLLPWLT
ncbi:MAG: cyclic nucleotide-binding domain-containing protein [Thermomicrobiales bacterium]